MNDSHTYEDTIPTAFISERKRNTSHASLNLQDPFPILSLEGETGFYIFVFCSKDTVNGLKVVDWTVIWLQ